MKFAFTTLGTPDWSLEQVAKAAREYGYDGVELRLIDGEVIGAGSIRANRTRIENLFSPERLPIVALASSAHFSSGDPLRQAENQESCRELIGLAASLRIPLIRVFGGKRPAGVDVAQSIENVARGLNAVAEAAADAGVTVMLETHDDFCSSQVVAQIMRRVPSEAIGVHWDVQNTYKLGETVSDAWASLGDRVVHVHIKDARRGDEPWERVLLGQGEVPVREAIELLQANRFAGYVCVETEKKWYPEQPAPELVLPDYIRGLRAYRDGLA